MATMNRWNLAGDYPELLTSCPSRVTRSRTRMPPFSQTLSSLTDVARPRCLALLAVLAMAAFPSSANARIRGYDGVWNVTFATTRGNCSSGYSVPFTVSRQPSVVRRRRSGLRQGQSQRYRRGPGLGRGLPCQRRRPPRWRERRRFVEGYHLRRSVQRHLACDEDVIIASRGRCALSCASGRGKKTKRPAGDPDGPLNSSA
ncbi:hypothetical protein ACVWZ6_000978 [Bradyrhizobium sp. GM6.1]